MKQLSTTLGLIVAIAFSASAFAVDKTITMVIDTQAALKAASSVAGITLEYKIVASPAEIQRVGGLRPRRMGRCPLHPHYIGM